jgi:hypothetical protein
MEGFYLEFKSNQNGMCALVGTSLFMFFSACSFDCFSDLLYGRLNLSRHKVTLRNCPVAEFINLSPKADTISPYFGGLFVDEPLPKNGFIDLPDRPGFGVTLCRHGTYSASLRNAPKPCDVRLENINTTGRNQLLKTISTIFMLSCCK